MGEAMKSITPKNLRTITHEFGVPFSIRIDDDPEGLICTELLRLLPGKRIVCKATYQSGTVIAKLFLDPVHAARHLKREVDGLNALYAAGIAAPKMIRKTTLAGGTTGLITEYLEDAVPLSTMTKTAAGRANKNVLERICKLMARLHKVGLVQNDLHLDNFLVKDDRIYAIDAADFKKTSAPLPTAVALKNLELLFAQFDKDSYPMLLDALAAYTQIHPGLSISKESLLAGAERKKRQIWNTLAKKIFRNCTDIIAERTWERFMLCKREYYTGPFVEFLNNPDSAIETAPLLKQGNSSTVAIVEIMDRNYVVKRYNIKNFAKLLRRQFPPSRAQRGWLYAHMLDFYNIATPKPIAMIETRFGPLRSTGYLVTEYVNANNVQRSLELAKDNPDTQNDILTRCAQVLKKLSARNISHGDCKATNFFDTRPDISIVDLDGMTRHRFRMCCRRAHQKDRLRFLQNFQNDTALYERARTILHAP